MHARLPLVLALAVLPSGLAAQFPVVGIWRLDETTGLVAADSGPFGNDGTLSGYGASGSWGAGQINNALSFDGVDDYVDLSGSTGLPIYRGDGSPYTFACWVKGLPQEDDRIYSEGESGATTNGGSLFTIGSGRSRNGTLDRLQIYIRNSDQSAIQELYSASTVFDDTWHHIAFVDVAGDAKLYVDGALDAASFDYRTVPGGTQTAAYGDYNLDAFSIGAVLRNNVVAHMTGSLDELHLFGFALSAADVQALMMSTIPPGCRASIGEFGVGCGVGPLDLVAGGDATLGGTGITLQLDRGQQGALGIILFGIGPISRLDLGQFGFAGCTNYVPSTSSFGVGGVNSSGMTRMVTIPVPATSALACGQIDFQGATVDFGTGVAEFSDVAIATLGN